MPGRGLPVRSPALPAILILAVWLALPARAQKSPDMGYVYPPGGRAGTTVNVRLGGYDWTPDLQFFVHSPGVRLEILGPPGPVLVPPPPYWFGPKSFSEALPLPREIPARFIIPPGTPPGPVRWQVANANGASATGVFLIGDGPETIEDERPGPGAQPLASLPITVSGRVSRIEEVDRYRFTAAADGLVTCQVAARRVGSGFHSILEVRDAAGRVLADAADTQGRDTALTFAAARGAEYVVSIHDLDFNGDFSFVYRLEIRMGGRVLAAFPAAGRRGETREVRFVGIGLATGRRELESITCRVPFPADPSARVFRFVLGPTSAAAAQLLVSDMDERTVPEARAAPVGIDPGSAVTGALHPGAGTPRYVCRGAKGDVWRVSAASQALGGDLDLDLAVFGPNGKLVTRNDDEPGTTDAGLEMTLAEDGDYTFVVAANSGNDFSPASVYRIAVERARPDFVLEAAPLVNLPVAGTAELLVKVRRSGGFKESIRLHLAGLPEGVSVPASVEVPAGASEFKIPLHCSADAPAIASLVRIRGVARIGETDVTRYAFAPAGGDLAPLDPSEARVDAVLLATTLKPKWKLSPVDKDGGRTVHRGTTYPAEVLVERLDGFAGEISLQMASKQSRHRQGITGPELPVLPGVNRIAYPCFMPEWLETSRTSRMSLIGAGRLPDARGNVRWIVIGMDGNITMSLEGALLKVIPGVAELTAVPTEPVMLPFRVARSAKLLEGVRLELLLPDDLAGTCRAESVTLGPEQVEGALRLISIAGRKPAGTHRVRVRATAMQSGKYPVVSEASIMIHWPP